MIQNYRLPKLVNSRNGEVRKAGFEFEFGNLPILQTAEALQQNLGGELDVASPFEATLRNSSLGKLKIERDANILKSVRYRKWLEQMGIEFVPGSLGHEIEANIDNASRLLIPCEVVTEPIPLDRLWRLDTLTTTLNSLGAEGTQDSLIYAFGLHINASVPDSGCDTLRRYIQAFLLLHSWIIDTSNTDLTRRFLTKYIDPFPQPYIELILDIDYKPDISTLIADYLEHNPTRNRALDMLPIFSCLDETRVLEAVNAEERQLVSSRPAFHYRLPDCKINMPGWSVAEPWNQWVCIEKLASDEALLRELIGEWRENHDAFSIAPNSSWTIRLTSLLARKFFEG